MGDRARNNADNLGKHQFSTKIASLNFYMKILRQQFRGNFLAPNLEAAHG